MWNRINATTAECDGYQLRKINGAFNLFTYKGDYIGSGRTTADINKLMAIPYPEQQRAEDWLKAYVLRDEVIQASNEKSRLSSGMRDMKASVDKAQSQVKG